jgi:hypothetical protein
MNGESTILDQPIASSCLRDNRGCGIVRLSVSRTRRNHELLYCVGKAN